MEDSLKIEKERKIRAITDGFKKLDDVIDTIREKLNILENLIEPILSPISEDEDKAIDDTNQAKVSIVAYEISKSNRKLDGILYRINTLIERAEV